MRLPQAPRCAAPRDGYLANAAGSQCAAASRQRATRASRVCARADRGSEIHDRLRVFRDACRRRAVERQRPELSCAGGSVGRFLDLKDARKHALDVAVEDRVTLAMREREDRARSRASDAGKRHQAVQRLGETTAVPRDDLLCSTLEVPRPRVIAKTRPETHHFVRRRTGKRRGIRKPRDEALEIRLHRLDLRLLQHDFRDPDPIWRRIRLPGQVTAAMGLEPQ